MNEIKLCQHLTVTVMVKDTPGNTRCGVCKKVWRWDPVAQEFYLIFDPKVDKKEDFDPERPRPDTKGGE